MTIAYLDTSAAMKLVVDEPESEALADVIDADRDRRFVASWLLHTELHCAAARAPKVVSTKNVEIVLKTVVLSDLIRDDLLAAVGNAPLRSNDAIHLAVATRLAVDQFFTYDKELALAAEKAGLTVICPR